MSVSQSRKKRRSHEEHGDDERWLITYSDMITLLMAFFIMLYAMSIVNLGKFNELAVSVRSGFGGDVTGLISPSVGFGAEKGDVPIQLPVNAFDVMSAVAKSVRSKLPSSEQDNIQFLSQEGIVKVRIKADGVLFARGSAALTPQAGHTLKAIAEAVQGLPYHLRVEGHTCSLPIRTARFNNNWELSAQRAVNVVLYFVETLGFSPTSLSAAGYADTSPVAAGDTEASRVRNRRIDIVLVRPSGGASAPAPLRADVRPAPPRVAPPKVRLVPKTIQDIESAHSMAVAQ